MYNSRMFDGLAYMFLLCLVVSAVAGWALIEGAIWLWHHISIGWLP